MILKMTNKDKDFYSYMGKIFGSRIVQSETKDRFYDDNNKIWYVYIDSKTDKALSFVSVSNNVIKNVYSNSDDALFSLLLELKNDFIIEPSIVTNVYKDIYSKSGFTISKLDNYKHFIMIRGENNNG